MEFIDVLMIKTKVLSFIHWSFTYEFLFNLSFLLFGAAIAKILLVIDIKEALKHDNRL
jgi:hypothetical protein